MNHVQGQSPAHVEPDDTESRALSASEGPAVHGAGMAVSSSGGLATGGGAERHAKRVRRRRGASRGAGHSLAQHTPRGAQRPMVTRWWFIVLSMLLMLAGCLWFALELRERDLSKARGEQETHARVQVPEESRAAMVLPNIEQREKAAALIDEALRARRDGNSELTLALLRDARNSHPWVRGLTLQSALIHLERGEDAEALAMATAALQKGTDVSSAHTVVGLLLQREGNAESALESFRSAHLADPLDSDPLFYWSETLRSVGRLREAVDRLDQALLRTSSESSHFLFQCKKDLAQVEMNPQAAAKMADEVLGNARAPGNLLLAAAAAKLQSGDTQAVGVLLERSAAGLPRMFLLYLLADPAFATLTNSPDLARRVRDVLGAQSGGNGVPPGQTP